MKKNNPMVLKRKRVEWLRLFIQLVFFLFAPSVYSAAFAGVKNSVMLIGQGKPLEINSFVIQFLIVCLLTMLAGRYFCGWMCAFGMINDIIFRLSTYVQKKTKRKFPRINPGAIRALRFMKYAVLFSIILLCFKQKTSIITADSPWTAFSLIRSGHFDSLGVCTVGLIILILLIPGMALHERFFCQFFCPMGAIFSLLPVNPRMLFKRNKSKCPDSCMACKKVCPVSIMIDFDDSHQGECICCGRCKLICPRRNIGK